MSISNRIRKTPARLNWMKGMLVIFLEHKLNKTFKTFFPSLNLIEKNILIPEFFCQSFKEKRKVLSSKNIKKKSLKFLCDTYTTAV